MQRKVVKPANFADLQGRLVTFETRCNTTASAYHWRYTNPDLNAALT